MMWLLALWLTYLLLQDAVEYEDEHSLQRVEDGEEIGHDDGALVDVHQAKGPGQAQEAEQRNGSDHPGPIKHQDRHAVRVGINLTAHSLANNTMALANGLALGQSLLY